MLLQLTTNASKDAVIKKSDIRAEAAPAPHHHHHAKKPYRLVSIRLQLLLSGSASSKVQTLISLWSIIIANIGFVFMKL